MEIYQDSADFYDKKTGKVIFTALVKVKDFDMDAALEARYQFEKYAEGLGLNYSWTAIF